MADDPVGPAADDEDALLELEPLTPMQEWAIEAHEMYEAYLYAGFNPRQALWLSYIENSGASIEPPDDGYFDLDESS